MAIILPPGTRVATAAGVPISGAKVRVYNANTTTLATIYSDVGLSVPLTNPVVCNSAGYPSSNGTTPTLIFAAANNYDVAFLDASDNVLAPFDDSPAVGADNSTFSRDFTNSRVQITGSGGVIRVEAGDASPDNSGGQGKLGGWNDTQADSWIADAEVFDTTGYLKENGKKLPGSLYTDATTFTAQTAVNIALPNSPSGARAYRITVFDFTVTASSSIQYQASFDGGATVKSGASDYDFASLVQEASVAVATGDEAAAGGTNVIGDGSITTPTNRPGRIEFEIITPNSGSDSTLIIGRYFLHDSQATPVPCIGMFATWVRGGYGRMTHLRLVQATGAQTMSGKYRVERLYGFGET
jgi:hypothetical protein